MFKINNLAICLAFCFSLMLLVIGCDSLTNDSVSSQREAVSNSGAALDPSALGKRGLDYDFDADTRTFDEQLADITRQVPGFAGAFLQDGQLMMNIKDVSRGQSMLETLQSLSPASERSVLAVIQSNASERQVQFKAVRYDFLQLHKWRGIVEEEMRTESAATLIDTDERRNRIVIGVKSLSDEQHIRTKLLERGIPTEAIEFEEIPPAVALVGRSSEARSSEAMSRRITPASSSFPFDLRDHHRPTFAGQRIEAGGVGDCTLGANMFWWDNNSVVHHGFLTNAHCTGTRLSENGVVFKQIFFPIGVEFLDAKAHSCSSTAWCFWADAAIIEYDDDFQGHPIENRGYIGRTLLWDPNCGIATPGCPTDLAEPYFFISHTQYGNLVGTRLNKVGQITGWTDGLVSRTCFTKLSGDGYDNWCQNEVEKDSNAPSDLPIATLGDSGAPVFYRRGESAWDDNFLSELVNFSGMVWGAPITPQEPQPDRFYYTPYRYLRAGSKTGFPRPAWIRRYEWRWTWE